MEITWRVTSREGWGEIGVKGPGNTKHNWYVQNIPGEVKNSMGNGEDKDLICSTHGYELRAGECWWDGGYRAEGDKGEKKMGQL